MTVQGDIGDCPKNLVSVVEEPIENSLMEFHKWVEHSPNV